MVMNPVRQLAGMGDIVVDSSSEHGEFEAKEWPFYWLTHATGLYLSKLERGLKRERLDIPRWRVLMCVNPGDARSVSEIAELAIVKLPTMMKLIQRMEAESLVVCETRVNDGRVTDVRLTEEGVEARQRAWNTARKIFGRVFGDRNTVDFDSLNKMLRQIVTRLEND